MTRTNPTADPRELRLELLTRAIRAGTYDPDPGLVAERMLRRAPDLADLTDDLTDECAVASAR